MNKRGKIALIIGIVFIIILIVVMFFYFATITPKQTAQSTGPSGPYTDPKAGLTLEAAKENFNETFIFYLLYEIKAYNLHNPPLSKNTPKIEIKVDELTYNAEIIDGSIKINDGGIEGEDIVITTTREEAVKMLQSKEYISKSFEEGASGIELKASKTILFSKGYLTLYNELTGESVTGNVIKIYTD